jgi:hypothetical protein
VIDESLVSEAEIESFRRDGAKPTKPHLHPSVDHAGIKVGEPIASELTLIVWPRARGDFPAPPRFPLTEVLARHNACCVRPDIK